MATCIYCSNEADGREHWLPRGLGTFRGFTHLLDRLCENCNQRLGRQLDEVLMRTGTIGFHRALLGVEGRHEGVNANPYRFKAMQAEPPTTMKMPADGRDYSVLAEGYRSQDGRPSARPIRQVVLEMADGSKQSVPFSRGWKAEQLREAVKKRGLQSGKPIALYLDDGELGEQAQSPKW